MKIDKKLIKELVDCLSEFNITEIEYQDGGQKIKVSKATKAISDKGMTSAERVNLQQIALYFI